MAAGAGETESRLKAYQPAGKVLTLVVPNRQLERKSLRKTGQHPRDSDDQWLIRQQKDDETFDNALQAFLECRNNKQQQQDEEKRQPKRENLENNLELRVVSAVEDNSPNLVPRKEKAILMKQMFKRRSPWKYPAPSRFQQTRRQHKKLLYNTSTY